MIALAATSVIQDAFAAILLLDRRELCCNFTHRRGPVDILVAAIGPSALGRIDAVCAVLVEIHALRLFANVALRDGMRLIALDLGDSLTFGLDF